jgi:hypothetical protein
MMKQLAIDERFIIRTSDRTAFKHCRVKWDYGSRIRQNWHYVGGAEPLEFGSAIHAAMEVIYDPTRFSDFDRSIRFSEAHVAFDKFMKTWKERLTAIDSFGQLQEDRYYELIKLGHGMLDGYETWSLEEDQDYVPILV